MKDYEFITISVKKSLKSKMVECRNSPKIDFPEVRKNWTSFLTALLEQCFPEIMEKPNVNTSERRLEDNGIIQKRQELPRQEDNR